MSRVCPGCGGANVRRSSTPEEQRTWRNNFYARYRCRDCVNEFWVLRHRTYLAGYAFLAAIVLAIAAVFVIEFISAAFHPDNRPQSGTVIGKYEA